MTKSKNLLMIGDCNTFPEDLLPVKEQLGAQIQKRLAKLSGTNINVTNLAKGMATTREGLARLKDSSVIPDYVVINFGLVDSWITTIPKLYISYYPPSIWRKYPLKWLKMLKKRLRYIKKIIPQGNVVPKQEYINNITRMIEICRTRNPQVKIVIWTTTYTTDDENRNTEIKKYNTYLKEISKREDCNFLDSTKLIDHKKKDYYLDSIHLSYKGIQKIEKEITQNLQ